MDTATTASAAGERHTAEFLRVKGLAERGVALPAYTLDPAEAADALVEALGGGERS